MNKRIFTLEDQRNFALFSGDHNPIHIDDVVARRLLFGSSVAHGIHQVLWSLDCWLTDNEAALIELNHIHALFLYPVKLGVQVELKILNLAENHVRLSLYAHGDLVTKIEIRYSKITKVTKFKINSNYPPVVAPNNLTINEIESRKGKLELFVNKKVLNEFFPNLSCRFSINQIGALLATTRLIGSECPGLNSVYAELILQQNISESILDLAYSTQKIDRRIDLITINVKASDLEGTLKTFYRPLSCLQPIFNDIKTFVIPEEFSNQRPLIIGGSRGLGEITSKLLSAGGAEVCLTYANDETDALNVTQQINSAGHKSTAFQLNVLSTQSIEELVSKLSSWEPTHLYYFATPHITTGRSGKFSKIQFKLFCDYYVHGLLNILGVCKLVGIKKVFNPSSIMVEQPPKNLVEYAAAKSASETACLGHLSYNPQLTIYQPRLPKMNTDQTMQIASTNLANPLDSAVLMLEYLRAFNRNS